MKKNISIPDELNAWLESYCKANGRKVSTFLAFLISEHREKGGKVEKSIASSPIIHNPEPVDTRGQDLYPDLEREAIDPPTLTPPTQHTVSIGSRPKTIKKGKLAGLCPHFVTPKYCKTCNPPEVLGR